MRHPSSWPGVRTKLPGSRLELSAPLWWQQFPALLRLPQTLTLAPWLLPLAGLSRSQPKHGLASGGPYDLTKDTSGTVLWRAHPLTRTALMWRLYFCRHPVMRKWPRQYEWFFMKMKIEHIWLQKWYGGVADISREEYFKAVPRKAWWSEKKVLDVCVKWKPFERCCQTVIDCCLFEKGFIAALSISQQSESGSPGTPVLAGDWSGHLQRARSHRDFTWRVCLHVFSPDSPMWDHCWLSKWHVETVAVPFFKIKKKIKTLCLYVQCDCFVSWEYVCCLLYPKQCPGSKLIATTEELNTHHIAAVLCLGWGCRTLCLWVTILLQNGKCIIEPRLLECTGHSWSFFPTATWQTMWEPPEFGAQPYSR